MKNWKSISREWHRGRGQDLQPFPGLYPTRWEIWAKYHLVSLRTPERKFYYLGKPNSLIAARFQWILRNSAVIKAKAVEFDRGGALAFGETGLPQMELAVVDWCNQFRFYYPWLSRRTQLITFWTRRIDRVQVTFQGRPCILYCTDPDTITPEHWQEHKTWLDGQNLRLGKPELTSTNLFL